MAVFVAASDETSGGNALSHHHYSGWVMSESDWTLYFTPAWQERVLDRPPKIPYLHMTEMRSKCWREEWGLTEFDADEKLDEAARVISQMGSMYPLNISVDGGVFRPLYKPYKMTTASGAQKNYEVDYFTFMAYALSVLSKIHAKNPEAERVDFLVESNGEITKHIHELYKEMPGALTHINRPELIPLVGEFLPAGKDRAPLQAADYLCWYARRAREQTLTDERDQRRWGTISDRPGFTMPVADNVLVSLADAFKRRGEENETDSGVRGIRQNHARSDERVTRRNKKRTRRRKGSKDAKKAEG